MIENKDKINYLYASDDKFSRVLGTSLYSLYEKNFENIEHVYIICQGIKDENKKKIMEIEEKFNMKDTIIFIEMPNFDKIIGKKADIKRYSASMFSRILISSLLPKDVNRIIYLDCDTMINTSLEELWEYDLKNKPIGAVNDYRSVNYQKNLGIMEENCYINSGVLLIDLIKYKENKLEERLVNAIGKYNGILEFPDNDVICKIAQNEIELLPLKYNVTSIFFMTNYKELKTLRKPNICDEYNIYSSAISNPSIVHFTTCFLMNGRPWMKNCNHPLTNKYLEYYKKTAWKDEPLQEEKSNLKNKIKRTIVKILPRKIMIFVVGIVHAYIKPLLQRKKLKSTRNKEIE